MENVAISRGKQTNNKENKENHQPDHRKKAFVKREKTSVVPFQLKGNKKEEAVTKGGQDKQESRGPVPGKNPKTMTDGRRAAASDIKRKTHSQVFLTEQAVRHKKTLREVPKPPATVPPSKPVLGTYKGKVVQSKIGSIWKSSDTVASADAKPSALKTERKIAGSVSRNGVSKSAADMSGRCTQNPATTRCRLISDRSSQVSKSTSGSHCPARIGSARPPTRILPAVVAGSRNTNVAQVRPRGSQNPKPKAPVADKVTKPAASSSLSQYRCTMETAEERRAKLAEWLASKGKTLKRPAMKAAAPPKPDGSGETDLRPRAESHLTEHCKPEPELSEDTRRPDLPAVARDEDAPAAEPTAHKQTPEIMNTTLDLLDSSDADVPDESQDGVDDIIVNLCEVLEAMATPSACSDEPVQVIDDVERENKSVDGCEKEPCSEMSEHVGEKPEVEHVKSDVQRVEDEEKSDEGVLKTTPGTEASVIKYSVKTTPFLQSVKKTIEEVSTSTSRSASSSIKDLKFLTPVRRSTRIQRKSSRLPAMLADHDLCVSSLAELVKLDNESNAYVYRKNPALLDSV